MQSSNLGRTCCVKKLFLTFRTIFVHNMFSPYSAEIRASDKGLPVQGNKRIVKLIDFEERTKADGMGKELLVVMEKGSRDLANLLKELSGIHHIFSFTY